MGSELHKKTYLLDVAFKSNFIIDIYYTEDKFSLTASFVLGTFIPILERSHGSIILLHIISYGNMSDVSTCLPCREDT